MAEVDTSTCDQGVAYAVNAIAKVSPKHTSDKSSQERMSRLASILGHTDPSDLVQKGSKKISSLQNANNTDAVAARLLPPRVALEHADASIRLNAISQLKQNEEGGLKDADLVRSLFRRLSLDDNPAVVVAAANSLEVFLKQDEADELVDDLDLFAKESLEALIRWTFIGKDDSWSPSSSAKTTDKQMKQGEKKGKKKQTPQVACIHLCGIVTGLLWDRLSNSFSVDDETANSDAFCMLVLSLGAHVQARNVGESSNAASAELLRLSGDDDLTITDFIVKHPISLYVMENFFNAESASGHVTVPASLQKRFLWLALMSFSSVECSNEVARQMLDLILYQSRFYTNESKQNESFQWEVQFLLDNTEKCLASLAEDVEFVTAILQLASTPSKVSLDAFVRPVLQSRLRTSSNILVLIKACLQSQASKESILRLLAIAKDSFDGTDGKVANRCIMPALALLSHPERDIREHVLSLLAAFKSATNDDMTSSICSAATDKRFPIYSSLVMDGANSLPQLLANIVLSSKSPASLQESMIKACMDCSLKEGSLLGDGCQATAVILYAMEKAGEKAFPLSKRWEYAGSVLFQTFLTKAEASDRCNSEGLRDCVVTMLKGVVVNETSHSGDGIQISVGPTQSGRRMRSYSVGTSESVAITSNYDTSMIHAVLDALASTSPVSLTRAVIQLAVHRQSWANGVFSKLDQKTRHNIASALLSLRSEDDDELAGTALFGLPLKALDFVQLLKHVDATQSETNQAALVFIADAIRGKVDLLGKLSDVSKLSSSLFDQLLSLSATQGSSSGDSGGKDYTRVSILQALLAVHSHYKTELSDLSDKHNSGGGRRSRSHSDVGSPKTLASHANILVGLVGGDGSSVEPLNSGRGRALCLSLLTCLCEESPSSIVTSLLPAVLGVAGVSSSTDTENTASEKRFDVKTVGDALLVIVPAYCAHSSAANLSLFTLLENFVAKIVVDDNENEKSRYSLLAQFVESLKLLPSQDDARDSVTSLVACVTALEAFNIHKPHGFMSEDNSQRKSLAPSLRVLANATSAMKISVSLGLLEYAEKLMSVICGVTTVSEATTSGGMKVDIADLTLLALHGPESGEELGDLSYSDCTDAQKRSIFYLTISMLQTVREATSTPAAKKLVRNCRGVDADLCLRLWQELMQTHISTLRAHAKLVNDDIGESEKKFWEAAPFVTSQCLENLQNLLPVPHFLASVHSILTDESADTYIRKKTIHLLADRVADVGCDSPEASLFLEMVPELVAQVNVERPESNGDEDSLVSIRRTIVMQQGALIAIESFVRALYPQSENSQAVNAASGVFVPALTTIAHLVKTTATSWLEANAKGGSTKSLDVGAAECSLLSSASLCVATLVKNLKARCLPLLPSIVNPLTASLKSINGLVDDTDDHVALTGKYLQLSILRTLLAISEVLPNFLLPYLTLIFSSNALPSKTLHQGNEEGESSIRAAAEQVESALATKTPIRQLIPCLSQALANNLTVGSNSNWEEACVILQVMNMAVESSQRSELNPIVGKIFNGLVVAYGYDGDDESKSQLLTQANTCLLSLVMKLSEAQLRPLYARLREWRGDIDTESEDDSAKTCVRRSAFWSLSAELSRSLRSIFLPCLTSVVTDVVDELVSYLCLTCTLVLYHFFSFNLLDCIVSIQELAVNLLSSKSKGGDSKRRRIDEDSGEIDGIDEVKPLQPLLLCLESALKADAHEGGDWTRGDDNQRYKMILSHLGKLLLSHVPSNMHVVSDLSPKEQSVTSNYQQLVQGVGTLEHGNVVGCLTALATAAGNEQLWKPLNFSILEACEHRRSEVRKAGVSCLLSIIETIGEEYMVLLPECLPILSELLEDGDEEIAAMAKECVRQGEELLGESLEESLR